MKASFRELRREELRDTADRRARLAAPRRRPTGLVTIAMMRRFVSRLRPPSARLVMRCTAGAAGALTAAAGAQGLYLQQQYRRLPEARGPLSGVALWRMQRRRSRRGRSEPDSYSSMHEKGGEEAEGRRG